MIELKRDSLVFTFPEVHPEARLRDRLPAHAAHPRRRQRLPAAPGLGSFPLRHVDDYHDACPSAGSATAASCCPCTSPRPCG